MSKLTLEDAAQALLFKARHEWRKLEEKKPPNELGHYQVFPVRIDGEDTVNTDSWYPEDEYGEEGFANDPEGSITHWAYLLDRPEEEE